MQNNHIPHSRSPYFLVFAPGSPRDAFSHSSVRERRALLTRVPAKSLQYPPSFFYHRTLRKRRRMSRDRRSLQALRISPLLHSPSSTPPASPGPRIHSSIGDANYFIPPVELDSAQTTQASPPTSFLLDDDPFANLGGAPAATPQPPSTPKPATQNQPRSPLSPVFSDRVLSSTPSSPPGTIRRHLRSWSKSVSSRAPIPAYQKPAFAPKPSLPSLDALSRMNIVLPKKVRKGRVGAGLPFEPWDNLEDISPLLSPELPRRSTISTSPPNNVVSDPNVDDTSSLLATLLDPPDQFTPSESVDAIANSVLFAAEVGSHPASLFNDIESHHTFTSDHHHQNAHTGQLLADDDDDVTLSRIQSEASSLSSSPPDLTLSLPYGEDLEGSAHPYATDTESSLPSLSPSQCSPDESVGSSLSRSTSNSSGSSDELHLSASSRYGDGLADPQTHISADGETHLLNSAVPEVKDYFSFPTAYTSDTAAAISNWRHETLARAGQLDQDDSTDDNILQSLDEVASPFALVHPNSAAEVDISMYKQFPSSTFRGPRPARAQYPREQCDTEYNPYRGDGEASGRMTNGYPHSQARSNGLGNSWAPVSHRGGLGSGRDDGGDRNGRKPSRPSASMFSDSSSSEETEEEEEESADDNVPLARSIPTALTAQKSIRKQVREERERKKRERAYQAAGRVEGRTRQTTLRPAGAGQPVVPQAVLSSSQEAMRHAHSVTSAKPITRQRTLTLPGRPVSPFSPDDLMRKLQDVQVSPPAHRQQPSGTVGEAVLTDVDKNVASTSTKDIIFSQPLKSLRPSRSFHRPHGRVSVEDHAVPVPSVPVAVATQQIRRARSQSRLREEKPTFEDAQRVPVPKISGEHNREHGRTRRPSTAEHKPSTLDRRPSTLDRRPSTADRRPSTTDRELRPPMPPPPSSIPEIKHLTQQLRVFIGDMQRYNVVEIDDTTAAGDVVQMIEAQGSLKGVIGSGEWMVWEVAHDFGMERPIRHFERLSDVQASWNKDKLVNMFVLRLTPLAPLLSRSTIPSSSPTHAGYVEWESKRGKWSKRWLQLREHSLWLSKRDNGKDQTLLCSLSNFDAYHFSRPYKSPKAFAFAIKSTDKLSFFEDTSDYKHALSCSEKDGKIWMEKILLARSYVLHQERNVLFNPKSYGGQPTAAVSRAPTLRRPPQPFVSVANTDPFEPGSLLHRKP